MKKLLSIFASIGLLTSISTSVISYRVENKNNNQNLNPDLLKVDILVEDQNENELTTFNYETDFHTLGELMSAPENIHNYKMTDYGGDLGYFLDAIVYEKDGKTITLPEVPDIYKYYWALWWINDSGKEIYSDVGMTKFVFEEKSEHIIWRFTEI